MCVVIFPKRPILYISSLKLAGYAGLRVKTSFDLRGGILTQGPKIFIFNTSCSTFIFEIFGPGENIRQNSTCVHFFFSKRRFDCNTASFHKAIKAIRLMKTSSIVVETSRSTSQSDSIVRQTNKRSLPMKVFNMAQFQCVHFFFFQNNPNCTFQVSNRPVLLLGSGVKTNLIFVVAFHHKGTKSSFLYPHVALSYSIPFTGSEHKAESTCVAFFPKRPKLYYPGCQRFFFFFAGKTVHFKS